MQILITALTVVCALVTKIIEFRLEWLKMLPPEQLKEEMVRESDNRQFLHDLFGPIRTLVERIASLKDLKEDSK